MKRRGRPDKDKDGKGRNHHHTGAVKGGETNANGNNDEDNNSLALPNLDDESENQGFGTWLRSTDGVEMMRLFVIANSLLVFVTMAWPNMQEAFSILKEYVMGEEE